MRGYFPVTQKQIAKKAKSQTSNFEDSFMQEYKDNLNKLSTQRRESNVSSLQQLLGQKPFASEIIKQMKERLGLKEYFEKMSAEQLINQAFNENKEIKTVVANSESNQPEVFKKLSPQNQDKLKHFIENRIKTHHGHISIPALQSEILANFKSENISPQDVDDFSLQQYLNQEIIKEISNYNSVKNNDKIGLEIHQDNNKQEEDFLAGMQM